MTAILSVTPCTHGLQLFFFISKVVYGEDVAILAGDALLAQSFLHVAENCDDQPAERVLDVIRRLGHAFGPKGLAGGQMMDLECEGRQ